MGQTRKPAAQNCAAVNKEYLYILTIFPGSLRIPARAVLQNPFLRRIVDVDQAEALGIAAVPLKIVGQRPVEKAADVFVAVWEHADQVKPGKLTGFLAAIARNRAKNRIRSYHETVDLEDLVQVCAADDVEQSIDQKILAEMLQDVLNMLSAKDREILVRYYYYYESVKQVAAEMQMSESAVKMRMSRARKKMQQELSMDGLMDSGSL